MEIPASAFPIIEKLATLIKANPDCCLIWLQLLPKPPNHPIFHNKIEKERIQKLMNSVERF
jgi:hypothetical protein